MQRQLNRERLTLAQYEGSVIELLERHVEETKSARKHPDLTE
jgi:hypothetical protein